MSALAALQSASTHEAGAVAEREDGEEALNSSSRSPRFSGIL